MNKIDFRITDKRASAPVVTNNGIDLKCIDILTEVGKDMRIVIIYRTGLEISVPSGHVGVITPVRMSPIYSLRDAAGIQLFYPDHSGEIVARYKTDTNGVPAVFEPGEVFARLIFVPISEIELNELPSDLNEAENEGNEQTGSDAGAAEPERVEEVAISE